ncbi:MAG: SH3 domain-containing protein [Gallionella sp.]|nr:SH3 domain-containing protein [Gallionella sp.]
MQFKQMIIVAALLVSASAQAGESATTIKADSLKAKPFSDAKVIASLPVATRVEILKKEGGWYQVKSPQGSGWVRMLSLRRGEARTGSSGSELTGLASLASGRAGTGKVVATTGIRGLNEEELRAAQFDEKQVALAESYTTTRAEAQKFAASARLTPVQMNYLPEPGGSSK